MAREITLTLPEEDARIVLGAVEVMASHLIEAVVDNPKTMEEASAKRDYENASRIAGVIEKAIEG